MFIVNYPFTVGLSGREEVNSVLYNHLKMDDDFVEVTNELPYREIKSISVV